ncbi:hypothetical protein APSETT445_003042 [Aspergillus pseudonomiae]
MGSMIIWDTGEYEILPYRPEQTLPETDDSRSAISSDASISTVDSKTENEKLRQAFHNNQRKIRLRLHGTKLPQDYTIILRLDKNRDFRRIPTTSQKRRRRAVPNLKRGPSTSSSGSSPPPKSDSTGTPAPGVSNQTLSASETPGGEHSDEGDIDEQIRTNNAYPGAVNSIGSVHQRRWFVTLDRVNSGFVAEVGSGPGGKRWVRKWDPATGRLLGFEPFYVRGPGVERSVVTGRLGRDVLEDEGVEGFVPRRGWRAVLE